MRIIGEIAHPNYKVTVFSHNRRVSIQVESSRYAHTYKFEEDEIAGFAEAERLFFQGNLAEAAGDIFASMHGFVLKARQSSSNSGSSGEGAHVFEEII